MGKAILLTMTIGIYHGDIHLVAAREQLKSAFLQFNQPFRIITYHLVSVVAHQPLSMYRLYQKEASWLESLAHLTEHLLVLTLILQIAKGSENVYYCLKLILKRNVSHVTMQPIYMDTFRQSFLLSLTQKNFTQILSSNLITVLSQWDSMPSMTTTQVEDATTLWQSQQVDDAINISLSPLRCKNRFIETQVIFSKKCFVPRIISHNLLLLLLVR